MAKNAVRIVWYRHPADGRNGGWPTANRSGLSCDRTSRTAVFTMSPRPMPAGKPFSRMSIDAGTDCFTFSPDPAGRLTVRLDGGTFVREPEWQYMVHRPADAQRGQDPDSDLFSPRLVSCGPERRSGGRDHGSRFRRIPPRAPARFRPVPHREDAVYPGQRIGTAPRPAEPLDRPLCGPAGQAENGWLPDTPGFWTGAAIR